MAWSDIPSTAQLNRLYYVLRWSVPYEKLIAATEYLRQNKTRKEVSDELGRIRKLYRKHALTETNCFDSEIWEDWEYDEPEP